MTRLNPSARQSKEIDSRLHVHAWTPGGFIHAGELEMDEDGDREVSASFTYAAEFLAQIGSGAYPLDPLNMRLSGTPFATHQHYVTLGAIFDAAPDAWGRKVVRSSLPAEQQAMVYRNAFLRGADGIGALLLTPSVHTNLDEIVAKSLAQRPGLSQLDDAARAARQLETNGEVDEELVGMLAGSWTIGGARPKAILRDDSPGAVPGRSLIAKFPSERSPAGSGLEWACLEMAHDMGLATPEHVLRQVGGAGGETALLLERFDRGPNNERRHYLSAMSLVSTAPQSKYLSSARDQATFSWKNLLFITSQVAARPNDAKLQMFARLALNAALGNSDDHLKNYAFLKCPDDPFHYEVAPVFDVTPQRSTSHYLTCGDFGRDYTFVEAMSNPRALGISVAAAKDVEERIRTVVAKRMDYFHRGGLTDAQCAAADAIVRRGMGDEPVDDDPDEPVERERVRSS